MNKAVIERHIEGFIQTAVVGKANTGNEQIRVIAGNTHRRQHAATFYFNGHHGATPAGQGGNSGLLHTHIKVKMQITPRLRINPLQHPLHPTARIGLDVLVTDFAEQDIFVMPLQARFTNGMGTAVASILVFIKIRQLGLTDSPYVANRVREQVAIGIMTHQLRINLHAFQPKFVNCKTGEFFFIEVITQWHRFEGAPALMHEFVEFFQIGRPDIDECLQVFERSFQIPRPLTHN